MFSEKDVFSSTKDSNGVRLRILAHQGYMAKRSLLHFFKLGKHTTNLEALFKVIILIGIDELNILATVEDNSVILIVRLYHRQE
jgi:hypothetical protein